MASPEATAAMLRLAAAQAPKLFGTAIVKGAAMAAGEAKGRAPFDTGNLIASIGFEATSATSAVVYAGAEYAPYVEYGTAPHEIVPKNAKVLAFNGIFTSRVSHPGTAPQPFMEPAVEATLPQIEAAAMQLLGGLL